MRRLFPAFMQAVAADIEKGPKPGFKLHRMVTRPLSLLHALAMNCRDSLYDAHVLPSQALPGKTISIGNIVVGGTGKSPLVIAVVHALARQGAYCAVLTRGYGSRLHPKDSMVLLNGQIIDASGEPSPMPDEARMQSVALPHVPIIVGSRRREAAMRFLAHSQPPHPTHWILDDGFQHRQLQRDLDIVLLDAQTPFGSQYHLPRGNLRESPASLKRADLVILTRASAHTLPTNISTLVKGQFEGPLVTAVFRTRMHPRSVEGKSILFDKTQHTPLVAVCGIARPEVFLAQLQTQGYAVADTYCVRDHAPFDPQRLADLVTRGASIVTTAKDFYRDPAVFSHLAVPVFLQEILVDTGPQDLSHVLAAALALPR